MKFDLNIHIIKNFVEVVEMGNITNAAEKLYITQPTLSRQISSLESSLNVTLLERMKSGVVLTSAGKVFYDQCLKFIQAYDDLMAKVYEFNNIVAGTLKVGYQKSSEDMIVNFHSHFMMNYPNVEINSFRQNKENFTTRLISNELDVAYLYGLELKNGIKNIKSMQVGVLKNMLLLSKNNPLADRKKVHLSELKDAAFVMPSKRNSPLKAQEIMNWCQKYGYTPNVVKTADSIMDYVVGIVQYNGIAILPYMRNMADSDQVKYLELEGYMIDYPVHVVWNVTNTNPILHTYLSYIEQQPLVVTSVPTD